MNEYNESSVSASGTETEHPQVDSDWWDSLLNIDMSSPETTATIERYIAEAGIKSENRGLVVDRFILWRKGYDISDIAAVSGVKRQAVNKGIIRVGHVLMGSEPSRRRRVRKISLYETDEPKLLVDNGASYSNFLKFRNDLIMFDKKFAVQGRDAIVRLVREHCTDEKILHIVDCYILLGIGITDIADVYNLDEGQVTESLRTAAGMAALGPYDPTMIFSDRELNKYE